MLRKLRRLYRVLCWLLDDEKCKKLSEENRLQDLRDMSRQALQLGRVAMLDISGIARRLDELEKGTPLEGEHWRRRREETTSSHRRASLDPRVREIEETTNV